VEEVVGEETVVKYVMGGAMSELALADVKLEEAEYVTNPVIPLVLIKSEDIDGDEVSEVVVSEGLV